MLTEVRDSRTQAAIEGSIVIDTPTVSRDRAEYAIVPMVTPSIGS